MGESNAQGPFRDLLRFERSGPADVPNPPDQILVPAGGSAPPLSAYETDVILIRPGWPVVVEFSDTYRTRPGGQRHRSPGFLFFWSWRPVLHRHLPAYKAEALLLSYASDSIFGAGGGCRSRTSALPMPCTEPLYYAGVNNGSGARVSPSRRRTPSILASPSPATRVRGLIGPVDFSVHRR